MRVRGLKQLRTRRLLGAFQVAPHAGAWIETLAVSSGHTRDAVAPHAGAWIETQWVYAQDGVPEESHPMRVRGLKRQELATNYQEHKSHPMRVRGLKR